MQQTPGRRQQAKRILSIAGINMSKRLGLNSWVFLGIFCASVLCIAIWSFSCASSKHSETVFERNLIYLRQACDMYAADNGMTASKVYETAGLLTADASFVEKYISQRLKGRNIPAQLFEGRTSPPRDASKCFPVIWNTAAFHHKRFVLLSTGRIIQMTPSEFDKMLKTDMQ